MSTVQLIERDETGVYSDQYRNAQRKAVESEYKQHGSEWFDRESGRLAFTVSGDVITAANNVDESRTAHAMMNLAVSKGWQLTRVEGTHAFFDAAQERYNQIEQDKNKADQPVKATKPEQPRPEPKDDENQVEKVREQAELLKQARLKSVQDQYRVSGSKYYFKDQAGYANVIAFKDSGDKLKTSLNSERVTRSLVELAEAKGWTDIRVSGHKEFRRQIWREAVQRGIEVTGYTPTAADKKTLETAEQNVVKKTKPTPDKRNSKEPVIGELVEHGAEKYNGKNDSYKAVVKTDSGDVTLWGKDLQRAITEARVSPGDAVTFQRETTAAKGVPARWIVREARERVVREVADEVAKHKGVNETDREKIRHGIDQRLKDVNEVPTVPMYDTNQGTDTVERDRAVTR